MKAINLAYGTFDTKVKSLYDKEFTLNEELKNVISNAIADLRLLNDRYNYQTDIELVISRFQHNDYEDYEVMYVSKRDTTIVNYIYKDVLNPKYNMLIFKCRVLLTACIRYYHSCKRLKKYKDMKMPYCSFNTLNTAVNTELVKSILRGYIFSIGIGSVKAGSLRVEEIARQFDEQGIPTDKSVNWEESNTFKQALIDEGIEPYNKETAPNGKKWFIYHTEPFVYYINWTISAYSHRMIKFFKFEPTAFTNTKTRHSNDILDNPNIDVEDIINNPKLGFINKLNILLKKDPSYALTYR